VNKKGYLGRGLELANCEGYDTEADVYELSRDVEFFLFSSIYCRDILRSGKTVKETLVLTDMRSSESPQKMAAHFGGAGLWGVLRPREKRERQYQPWITASSP
jgi:hypothetical protein